MAATTWRVVAMEAYDPLRAVQVVDFVPIIVSGVGDAYYTSVDVLPRSDAGTTVDVGPLHKVLTVTGVTYSTLTPGSGFAVSAECATSKKIEIPNVGALSGDFTIEFWYLLKSIPAMTPLHTLVSRSATGTTGGFGFYFYSNKLNLMWNSSGNRLLGSWSVPPANTWCHLAVTRKGSVVQGWANGVKVWENSDPVAVAAPSQVNAGPVSIGGDGFYGAGMPEFLVNDFRITRGVARYTADALPPGPHPISASTGAEIADPSTYVLTASEAPAQGALSDMSDPTIRTPVELKSKEPGAFIQWFFASEVEVRGVGVCGVFREAALEGCVLQALNPSGLWETKVLLGAVPFDANNIVLAMDRNTLPVRAAVGIEQIPQSSGQDCTLAMRADVSTPGADVENGGSCTIHGTVELYVQTGNIPLPRRVRLHRSRDGLLVRETWSDAQGNYRFDGITDRYKYDVIAWDHEGLQQSVVANDLTPEVTP